MQRMRSKNYFSFSIPVLPQPGGQNQMPGKQRKSGREAGNAGEGKSVSRDAECAAEELGGPLPGLLPPHLNARQCDLDVCGVDSAHH